MKIEFTVNEKKYTSEKPNQLLVEFLHEKGLHGTKLVCGEGGCGGCTVMVDKGDQGKIAINSCLRPVGLCHGLHITTIEGLGNEESLKDVSTNDVRSVISRFGGSQCGYCTPGFTMTMESYRSTCENNGHSMNEIEIEDLFSGNLCRCTGYRPILCGFKTFASSGNKEELTDTPAFAIDEGISYGNRGLEHPNVSVEDIHGNLEFNQISDLKMPTKEPDIKEIIQKIKSLTPIPKPKTWEHYDDEDKFLEAIKDSDDFKIVCGNTSIGIYKDEEWRDIKRFINVSGIKSLNYVSVENPCIKIGATATMSQLMETIKKEIPKHPNAMNLQVIYNHMRRIAGLQVRNAGSVVGNLAMAWKRKFVSDLFVAFATSNAKIVVKKWENGSLRTHKYPLIHRSKKCLMKQTNHSIFISEVIIPFISSPNVAIGTYKVAKRLQNSHALVNAGFKFPKNSNNEYPFIIVGNLGKGLTQLKKTEKYIYDNNIKFSKSEIREIKGVMNVMKEELESIANGTKSEDPIPEKVTIALNLFYKFLVEHFQITTDNKIMNSLKSIYLQRKEKPSKGKQEFFVDSSESPVSEPLIKSTAWAQAKGEAIYTQNTQIPPNCLHAAFIQSNRATGIIKKFHRDPIQLLIDHFIIQYGVELNREKTFLYTYLSPELSNANLLSRKEIPFPEYLLANQEVVFYGQAVALVVAEEDWIAKEAAKYLFTNPKGFIEYENSYNPILNLDSSVPNKVPREVPVLQKDGTSKNISTRLTGSYYEFLTNIPIEKTEVRNDNLTYAVKPEINWVDFENNQDKYVIIKGSHEIGSQYHFYMETQSALAIPDLDPESDTHIILYASTQVHTSIKDQCQKMLNNLNCQKMQKKAQQEIKVVVEVPQLGGGFGGKEPQSKFTALGATFLAYLLKKPVRLVLDRNSDMRMIGKRHPFRGYYKIAARRDDGVIEAMEIDLQSEAGATYDTSFPVMDLALLTSMNAYNIEKFLVTGNCYFTNKATSTAMRSFGVIQSHQIMESAIEKLSETLHKSSFIIRANNFFPNDVESVTPYGQPVINCNMKGIWDAIDSRLHSDEVPSEESEQLEETKTRDQEQIEPEVNESGCGYNQTLERIQNFNSEHKWKKRGFSVLPLMYGISFTRISSNYGEAKIEILKNGEVRVITGGVEMGQGIETKIRQITAYKMGIKSTEIKILPFTTEFTETKDFLKIPGTGASTGTDLNGGAVSNAAKKINEFIEKHLENNPQLNEEYKNNGKRWFKRSQFSRDGNVEEVNLWPKLIEMLQEHLPYVVHGEYQSPNLTAISTDNKKGKPFYYFNYAAASSEVEIDILTGEFNIIKSEIIYDAGVSINPAIDIGQIEGGFIQGIGCVTTEEIQFDESGKLITDGTWEYKIPSTTEIPQQFNVSLYPTKEDFKKLKNLTVRERMDSLKNVIDTYGIQSSKTTGEPPLVLSNSVFFAIKDAIKNFRNQELDDQSYFDFSSPATTFKIQQACRFTNEKQSWIDILINPSSMDKNS